MTTPEMISPEQQDLIEKSKEEGNKKFMGKDYTGAIRCYDRCLKCDPHHTKVLLNRSFAHFHCGDYRSAVRDAFMSVQLEPKNAKAYYRFGMALCGLQQYLKALEVFNVGMNLLPGNLELKQAFIQTRTTVQQNFLNVLTWHPREILGFQLETPNERCGHSATLVGFRLLVFGGFGLALYNDLMIINLDTMTLVSPPPVILDQDKLLPRSSHTAAFYGDNLILFGGFTFNEQTRKERFLNEMVYLHTKSLTYTIVPPTDYTPAPRSEHSCTHWGDKLIFFGGHNQDDVFNDVHIYHLRKQRWKHGLSLKGYPPPPRYAHSATLIDNKLFIFGGSRGPHLYYNDVWCLDLHLMRWNLLETDNPPKARMGHTASLVGNRLFVYGGIVIEERVYSSECFILDTDTLKWSAPQLAGTLPPPRLGHSATLFDSKLIVFGGDSGQGILKDIYIADIDLEVQQLRWELQDEKARITNLKEENTKYTMKIREYRKDLFRLKKI